MIIDVLKTMNLNKFTPVDMHRNFRKKYVKSEKFLIT